MPQQEKKLTAYPISSGDELNVFAGGVMTHVRIMDMQGNVLIEAECDNKKSYTLNIKHLNNDTYLAEVAFKDAHTERSIFVKL
ncbi:MAG: hypothetical protein R2800_15080 [Flavipsychrobacter sp.]